MSENRGLRISYCAFVVGLVGLVVFLPALGNGFAYDDAAIVGQDGRVHSLAHIATIFRTGYWANADNGLYRPLTTLSFAIDWSLASGSSAWFHFTNALAHGVASALAVLLLARFFTPGAALFGGLVFALHPVHVEAVANVVGRADVFAASFMLGACLLWSTGSELPVRRVVRVAGVAGLYACALLTKESAVMLPALLLLVDIARGALRRGAVREYLRDNGTAFSTLVLVMAGWIAVRSVVLGGWGPSRLDPSLEIATEPLARLLTALQAWPVYLRLLFYPRTLLADYGPRVLMPLDGPTLAAVAGAALLAACLVTGAMAYARGHGRAALGLLWFPVAVFPVSNLVIPIGVLVAERTLYLPAFALSVGAAGGAAVVSALHVRPARLAMGAAAVAIIALLAARTIVRVPEWESTERIMRALVRDRPDAFRGQWHNARLAASQGDTVVALELYSAALRLWPHRRNMTLEAAGLAAGSGRTQMAYKIAQFAANRWPGEVGVQRLLAGAALDLGDTAVARNAVREGLRLDPHDDLLLRMSAVIPDPSPNEDEF